MNFDGDIKVHGRADVSALRENLNTLDFGSFKEDQALRHRLAPGRKGRAIWVLRPYLLSSDLIQLRPKPCFDLIRPNSYFELRRKIHCHAKYEGTDIFRKIFDVIDGCVLPHYQESKIYNIQIAELPGNCEIPVHTDSNLLLHSHRVHVPIITNSKVIFKIEMNEYNFEEGLVFELNNTLNHGVKNESAESRFHLICDFLPKESGVVVQHKTGKEQISAMYGEMGIESI